MAVAVCTSGEGSRTQTSPAPQTSVAARMSQATSGGLEK